MISAGRGSGESGQTPGLRFGGEEGVPGPTRVSHHMKGTTLSQMWFKRVLLTQFLHFVVEPCIFHGELIYEQAWSVL